MQKNGGVPPAGIRGEDRRMRAVFVLAICVLAFAGSVPAQTVAPAAPVAPVAPVAATVTVYRCTDAGGMVSYSSTPCAAGSKQQIRSSVRPVDAPPRLAVPQVASPPAKPEAAPQGVQRTVYLVPPRPMFECTTPDGKRYTSDDDRGNPRWVPLWTQGYRWYGNRPGGSLPRGTVTPAPPLRAGISTAFPDVPMVTPAPPTRPPHGRPPVPWQAASGGGSWIRDSCVALPPREACSLLRDRRDAIRTRFFNAQEKERDALRLEERGINTRLADDCGGR